MARRKTGKSKRKALIARKKRRANKVVNVSRHLGFPMAMIAKLRYTDYLTLTPGTAGVVDENVYRMNSIFDPDFTNGGSNHQPMYHDNYAAVYNHYIVIGAKVTCQFVNLDASNPCSVGLVWDRGGSVDTDELSIMELGRGSSLILTPAGGSRDKATLKYFFNAKRFFGVKSLEADDMGANIGANPDANAYIAAWVGGLGVDTGNCQLLVTIDYIVKFSRPKDQDTLN